MMAVLRSGGPYIWVTWLTRLLVGENSCEWAAWFRAQHESWSWSWDQGCQRLLPGGLADGPYLGGQRESSALGGAWYTVYTENQNGFALKGKSAMLSKVVRQFSAGEPVRRAPSLGSAGSATYPLRTARSVR